MDLVSLLSLLWKNSKILWKSIKLNHKLAIFIISCAEKSSLNQFDARKRKKTLFVFFLQRSASLLFMLFVFFTWIICKVNRPYLLEYYTDHFLSCFFPLFLHICINWREGKKNIKRSRQKKKLCRCDVFWIVYMCT